MMLYPDDDVQDEQGENSIIYQPIQISVLMSTLHAS